MKFGIALLGFGLLALPLAAMADSGKAPIIVEMFTSKYCPNCPMAEHRMKGEAEESKDLLIILEHVDYWDRRDRIDPYGLADVTQRQYDYSNTLMKRSGQVYTPMPLIDGQIVVSNPLMFSWSGALEKARALPEKQRLEVSKGKDGSLEVEVPAALHGENRELWVLGVEPVEATKVWRVRGMVQGNMGTGQLRIPGPNLPKTDAFVVLLQEAGPGAVVAAGSIGVQK